MYWGLGVDSTIGCLRPANACASRVMLHGLILICLRICTHISVCVMEAKKDCWHSWRNSVDGPVGHRPPFG